MSICNMPLKLKKSFKHFKEKNFKKIEAAFTVEKVIKKKGNKLYVKSKGYDNQFNNSIDEKDIVM